MSQITFPNPTIKGRPQNSTMTTVFTNECVISKTKKMVVGLCGPQYYLVGHDATTKYGFVAFLNDTVRVDTISQIFVRLKQLGVNHNTTHLQLMGGWAEHASSHTCGEKIVEQLKSDGFSPAQICTRYFERKPEQQEITSPSKKHFYFGGRLNPKNERFEFKKTMCQKTHKLQCRLDMKSAETILNETYSPAVVSQLSVVEKLQAASIAAMDKDYPLTISVVE
jgi:hypothetical protein